MIKRQKIAKRTTTFTESLIREMTRVNNTYNAVNLAQGFPDFQPPLKIIQAAKDALDNGYNQYAITWGSARLRSALAQKFSSYNNLEINPDKHITITCGGTEAMLAAMLAVIDENDEVIIFEPFYENYGPDTILAQGKPTYVQLFEDNGAFHFNPNELRKAFSNNTRAIIINTPHNPTGKVFSYSELDFIANLCKKFDVLAITDEPYEHILFDGHIHYSIASLPGMANRTITINSISKSYSLTGWRVGWAIANDETISKAIRSAHDFITVGAAAPLQEAAVTALKMPKSYYAKLAKDYQKRRDTMLEILDSAGFQFVKPEGAYYVMTKYPKGHYSDDLEFAHFLSKEIGVTPVPGRAFYHNPIDGKSYVRFAFPKTEETLNKVAQRLSKLQHHVS